MEQGGSNRANLQPPGLQSQQSHASLRNAFNSDFFKVFSGGQKKTTRDGQPAKRRGPKPDMKPAMTRRQELNRQAQRTHRERKEQYIRSLETEVSRLREAYSGEMTTTNASLQQNRELVQSLKNENDILKEILMSHGIQFEAELERRRAERQVTAYQPASFAGSSNGTPTGPPSTSNFYTTPSTTAPSSLSPHGSATERVVVSPEEPSMQSQAVHSHAADPSMELDYSGPVKSNGPVPAVSGIFETDPQLQVDFILTLESPCRVHTEYLCRRSITEAEDENMPFSGHALMATCPPPTYIANTTAEQQYPHQTYDLPVANLSTLLNLSRQLVTEGQVTPIMALQCLKNHELYRTLTRDDVKIIMETLNTKIRCYGFGAVVEDFELMDCLNSVLGTRVEAGFSQSRDDILYS
ncbi:hypothetical protein ASPZODRAFT_133166 [Penicilliopsis zonata CBS 506.65]|uniref:BZIP domain-containing protein n=1 Tax=Penicilliopsis zonata CBS 506.65 TaxID=1073090 RepID=A0A1L9SGJ0_9EURO|nr:hypothetical protein ASPZODRAFT_133166 [Penicilliopsis zonata CBS 506.65]OJJ46164.1 hypothetical protein ASPZODRAFT_133166 [Penicilliopsis zonata CBS 506.65]